MSVTGKRSIQLKPMVWAGLLSLAILLSAQVNAEFDPERLSMSTVRVVVKVKGAVVSVASGFVWQAPNQVVTSLHVLSPDPKAKLIIEFGKKRRKSKVKAVLPEADLVLLEVSRPLKDWTPLDKFEGQKPKYKSLVTALGFNKGALGMSTRELVKGYAKPEVLEQLLPGKAARILAKTDMPSVSLPIYYLDGSLLPGYSGSPVVNDNGDLIGIGNGGLESGASSVSWVIPATNLLALEKSSISTLPKPLARTKKLFTLDKVDAGGHNAYIIHQPEYISPALAFWRSIIPSAYAAPADLAIESEDDLSWELPANVFREVLYQNFQFVRVKTRTFAQMLASSGRPKSISHALTLFQEFFPNYKIAYSDLEFDVYTDAHYGLNIIVPHGVDLTVDDGYLLAEGGMFCQTCPYEIQYHARSIQEEVQQQVRNDADEFLNGVADQHWDELNEEGDYVEYDDFRQIDHYGSERYVLRAAFSDFAEPLKDEFELNYFIAANNRDAWFQAQGILNRFDEDFFDDLERYQGTDCTTANLSDSQQALCADITTSFKVLASTHFTSFSNRIFSF